LIRGAPVTFSKSSSLCRELRADVSNRQKASLLSTARRFKVSISYAIR
jgi:hypothetical protein